MPLTSNELEYIQQIEEENIILKKIIEGLEIAYGSIIPDEPKEEEEIDFEMLVYQHFIKNLNAKEVEWVSLGIIGIICADKKITESEICHLRRILAFIDNQELIQNIMKWVHAKKAPIVPILKTTRSRSAKILLYLASVAMIDDQLHRNEVSYFKYLGGKLGYEPSFSTVLINWSIEFIKLTKKKHQIIKLAESQHPMYQDLGINIAD